MADAAGKSDGAEQRAAGEEDAATGPLSDEGVDEMERESFPASDPPSSWAGPEDAQRPPTAH